MLDLRYESSGKDRAARHACGCPGNRDRGDRAPRIARRPHSTRLSGPGRPGRGALPHAYGHRLVARMNERVTTLAITRTSPGGEARVEAFDVPYEDGLTLLDAVIWIRRHRDPSLAVR